MNNRQCLIIFTRYPEPGKTKTRMIPALGAEGAAKLQRQMTEYTLIQGKKLQQDQPISIKVYFTGGTKSLMEKWLGTNIPYQLQCEGDLGKRMYTAFEQAFLTGMEKVIIIGIDCPDLTPSLLAEGFDALEENELVLGPAEDGGYYLIGLRRLIPELFVGINWGTAEVLAKTKKIAAQLGLSIHYLPVLNDVDLPEDLKTVCKEIFQKGGVTELRHELK